MTLPLLYTFRRCPYAIRSRMALIKAGRVFEPVEVSLRNKPAVMLAVSPKGTVPVMVLPDATVLDESLDIMRWALESPDPDGWWERAQTAQNLELLAACDGAFKHHLDRYKYAGRYDGAQSSVMHRDQAVATMLLPLEQRLQLEPYLGGSQACATDIAIFPFVRQFAAVTPDWFAQQALPSTQHWLHGWIDSTLFAAAMVKL